MDYKYIPILLFGLLSLVLGFKTTMLLRLGFLTYNNSNSYLYIALSFALIYYFTGLYSTFISLLSVLMVEGILRRKLIKSYLFIVKDFYKVLRDTVKIEEDSDSDEEKEIKDVDFVKVVANQVFEFIDNANEVYTYVVDRLKKSVMLYYMFKVYVNVNNFCKSNELKQFLTDFDNNIGVCVKGLHNLLMQIPFVNSLSKVERITKLKDSVVKNKDELDEYETIDMDEINENKDNMVNIDKMLTSVLQDNELPNMNDMIKDMMKMKREGKMPVFNPENLVNQLDQLTQMVTKMEDLQKSIDTNLKQD